MESNNTKAMREALGLAKKAICNYARHTCDSLAWENSTINANCGDILCVHRDLCKAKTAIQKALAAPPRNCDKVKDHSDAIGKFEKWMGFSPKTADEQDAFFKEHWFEFAIWLIDMNESEVKDGGK